MVELARGHPIKRECAPFSCFLFVSVCAFLCLSVRFCCFLLLSVAFCAFLLLSVALLLSVLLCAFLLLSVAFCALSLWGALGSSKGFDFSGLSRGGQQSTL
jgi:hypothetical protein